jgi:hypothetical protein
MVKTREIDGEAFEDGTTILAGFTRLETLADRTRANELKTEFQTIDGR